MGYSDIFLTNGDRMGVDFLDIDQVVLSHAHLDHTWGLQHLIQRLAGRQPDFVLDDSALVYRSDRGLVIITGCAHAGICNTVACAMKVCGEDRVADIIGGFHLQDPPEDQLAGTVQYFKEVKPAAVHAYHCTDFHSRRALAAVSPLSEVGVGLTLAYT